jgi:NADH-quinone oxidoreductase subunit D
MAELGGIQDHLLCVGAAALDLGAFTGFLYGFNEREFIYDIIDYAQRAALPPRLHPRRRPRMQDIPGRRLGQMVQELHRRPLPRAEGLETLLNCATASSSTGPRASA